jgi:formylglycine-generating enzyme required for sulfatase activity
MTRIFISYRRQDSKYQARSIYAAFAREVGRENVFMDVDSIPPGANFRKILKDWVDQCEVLLALIGHEWLDVRDPQTGHRRLDNPSDFVRIEIGEALARDIPVVPVLLDGAALPQVHQLPDALKELCDRQAEFVEYRTFDADVERLIKKLRLGAGAVPPGPPPDDGRIKIDAAMIIGAPQGRFLPGNGKAEWFKDHALAPEMVVIPKTERPFLMGSPPEEIERLSNEFRAVAKYFKWEGPQVNVTIASPFAVSRYAVTRGEFSAFVNEKGLDMSGGAFVWNGKEWKQDPKRSWRDPGFAQDDSHPVVCVNWHDAEAYTKWLSEKTGKPYRLLSEAEWEYAARAGTQTPFWWGSSISPEQANYDCNYTFGGGPKGEWLQSTVPVSRYQPNPWGLYQVHGNVWEWCEDCWNERHSGAPADGSARTTGDCGLRVLRGGSWDCSPQFLRAARRSRDNAELRYYSIGFRVARTLFVS